MWTEMQPRVLGGLVAHSALPLVGSAVVPALAVIGPGGPDCKKDLRSAPEPLN
jgi:hypothetical protein